MVYKRLIFFALLVVLSFGCNKDKFPDEFRIQGSWIEKTGNDFKVEIEFRTSNRAYLKKYAGQSTDTLLYRLDKADELLLFLPKDFPNGPNSMHKLTYNQKKEELGIANLFSSVPGISTTTIFQRK